MFASDIAYHSYCDLAILDLRVVQTLNFHLFARYLQGTVPGWVFVEKLREVLTENFP
jgi:hypothetical protein